MASINLDQEWLYHLEAEFEKDYMKQLKAFLKSELSKGKTIYPSGKNYFAALNQTPFSQVKAVIVGQDPYHGPDQAHGLSFSVPENIKKPPSLVNIYNELKTDIKGAEPPSGNLQSWAKQGVLLLNSVLTVEAGKAGSHQGKGWETFTDRIIHILNEKKEHIVFILWGSYAIKKASFVDRKKHLVIESVHPSPLSAYRGFFGSKPFSKTNQYLKQHSLDPIQWLP